MAKMLRDRSRVELEVGCEYGCCRTNDTSRTARHRARRMERRELGLIVRNETGPDDHWLYYDPHVYDGERCIFCNVNCYDDGIYGPFECVKHDGYIYTTETP